jgi:hypothetical protein
MAESIPPEESIPRNRLSVAINFRFRRAFQSENTPSNEECHRRPLFSKSWSHLLLGCLILRARLFFGASRNLSNHMDKQARTGVTVL